MGHYECDKCGLQFPALFDFRTHMQHHDEGEFQRAIRDFVASKPADIQSPRAMDLEPRAVLNKVFDSFGADAVERALLFQVNNPVGCVAWAHCFLTTLGVERLVPEQLNLSPREYNYALTCLRLTGPLNASQLKGIAYAYVENARRLRQTLRKLSPGAVNV